MNELALPVASITRCIRRKSSGSQPSGLGHGRMLSPSEMQRRCWKAINASSAEPGGPSSEMFLTYFRSEPSSLVAEMSLVLRHQPSLAPSHLPIDPF